MHRQHFLSRTFSVAVLAALLSACGNEGGDSSVAADDSTPEPTHAAAPMAEQESPAGARLTTVLAAQSDDVKARYEARHPKETLTFFGIEPDMTVVEGDPSGGWYTGILEAYLGESGTLIGADYPLEVYRLFDYYSEEELLEKAGWAERWPGEAADGVATRAAFNIGSMPAALAGTADAYLFVRVLHNLADFEEEGAFFTDGLAEAFRILKPGGVVGIVQHMAPETHSDDWASGSYGYLKKSAVIAAMKDAGFVLEAESPVNENPRDMPTEEESVWRLPPTLEDPENPELAAAYAAIGESNRMTLRFRKPTE